MNKKIIDAGAFYNNVAPNYEKLINFEKNLQLRVDAYKNIFINPGLVADIGCGTGLDSIALARNGHKVIAFDVSAQMVKEAKINAQKYNIDYEVFRKSFSTIPQKYAGKFDYVISMGNTIAHLSESELRYAIKKIRMLLKPGGKFLLHILNYPLIIKTKKRINNIAVRDGRAYVRFYDILNSVVNFNILSFKVDDSRDYELYTTRQYPHSRAFIDSVIKTNHFKKVFYTGNFIGVRFNLRESKDLFIQAVK